MSQPPPEPNPSIWSSLKEALRGSRRNYTEGSIGRAVFLLAVPMVLEMLMQSVLEVVDIYFVGKLGADAVAAVGLSASLIILVFAVAIGLSMAATATVARRTGEGDEEGAAIAAVQALLLGFILSIPVAILGILYAPEMLALMGASEEVIAVGSGYCAVLFGGNATIILLFMGNACFRGAGDAAISMRTLWLANSINIVLDPLLIFGIGPFPEMGVTGAAVATTIGRGIGVAYAIWRTQSPDSRLRIRRRHLVVNIPVMKQMMKIGGPGVLQFLVGTASWMVIMRIMASFGSAAIAGYTIGIRIIVFVILPSWGLGNAAATLVGQNLGAGKPDRSAASVWYCARINVIFMTVIGLALIFFPGPIVAIFTQDPGVADVAQKCIRIAAYSFPLWAMGLILVQSFNGAGDTSTPTWLNLIAYWLLQLPAAWFLANNLDLGPTGVFICISAAQVVFAIMAIVVFRRGKWSEKAV